METSHFIQKTTGGKMQPDIGIIINDNPIKIRVDYKWIIDQIWARIKSYPEDISLNDVIYILEQLDKEQDLEKK